MKSIYEPFQQVSLNGVILDYDQPAIAVADQGLLYGYGVFDTLRIFKKKPFMLDRHIDRLVSSALILDINVTEVMSNIHLWLDEFILKTGLVDAIARITVTKGVKDMPCIIISSRPLTYTAKHYMNGFSAGVSAIKRNEYSPLARIKSLNYLDNILARRMANDKGFDEALMLNGKDFLCECSMSNIFFMKDEILHTPALGCGVLDGITGALVKYTIAPELNLSLIEGEYLFENLICADESFLTNSAMGIMPLVSVDGHPIGEGRPGKITRLVMKHYESILDERHD